MTLSTVQSDFGHYFSPFKGKRKGLYNKGYQPVRSKERKTPAKPSSCVIKALLSTQIKWIGAPVGNRWRSSFEFFWRGSMQDKQIILVIKGGAMSRTYAIYTGPQSSLDEIIASVSDPYGRSKPAPPDVEKLVSAQNLTYLKLITDILTSSSPKELIVHLTSEEKKVRDLAKSKYHELTNG